MFRSSVNIDRYQYMHEQYIKQRFSENQRKGNKAITNSTFQLDALSLL